MKKVFLELLKNFKVFSLKEKALSIGIVVFLLVISSALAYNGGKRAEINLEAVDVVANRIANQDEQIKVNNDKLADLQSQIDTINNELSSQQDLLNAFNDYKNNKEAKETEISQLDSTIQEKSNNIASLDNDIASKSAELDKLKNAIQRTGEEPKVLTAGEYTVGKDIEPGRYIVTGNSNFVVYSYDGDLKVNTILGGRYGEESYTCTLENGDTMELSSKDTFTPIK